MSEWVHEGWFEDIKNIFIMILIFFGKSNTVWNAVCKAISKIETMHILDF